MFCNLSLFKNGCLYFQKMPSTHSRFGPKNTGRSDVTVFNTVSEPPEETVYHHLEASPDNVNALTQMIDEDGRTIKRSRVYDDSVLVDIKSDSVNFGALPEYKVTVNNGIVSAQYFEASDYKFRDSSNYLAQSEFDIEAFIPDGKLVVTSAGGILCPGGIECDQVKSTNGPNIGPSIASNYVLPQTRGTSGQAILAGTGSSTAWTTLRQLPSTIATAANQTLLSTDTVGGLAWQGVSQLRAYNGDGTIPPVGVQVSLTTTSTNISGSLGMNIVNALNSLTLSSTGCLYSGAFSRQFSISFMCDLVTEIKDDTTFAFYLILVEAPQTTFGQKVITLKNNVFRTVDLTASGTLNPNTRIGIFALSSPAATCRIHNASLSLIMM